MDSTSMSSPGPQQSLILFVDHGITFAHGFLQFFALKHRDVATAVPDGASGLQLERSLSHALSTHSQHDRNLLMRHLQFTSG